MSPSAQLIIIELGCLDICNRNMRKFVVKYNQMECSCKRTSCFGNKMYYFGLLAFPLNYVTKQAGQVWGRDPPEYNILRSILVHIRP